MKKLIIINGVANSGKDTFIDMLIEIYGPVVKKLSTIDYVKNIALSCGWNGKGKTANDRWFLCELKSLLTKYNGGPYRHIKSQIDNILEQKGDSIIFVICREPEEIDRFKADYESIAMSLIIKREKANKDIPDNPSDKGVFDYQYDDHIDNNGALSDLSLTALKFLSYLIDEADHFRRFMVEEVLI